MPTLHWIGKDKVVNHHLEVPFKVLDHKYGFGNGSQREEETNSGNKIIHGDNLEALKALLPEYVGRIKCIYIDPPYNTGNEGWVYNDNINDPKFREWLNKVVGKDGEDLSRHDKWLCMMYPRLKLLNSLLADDGVIFISIDDIEVNNLKLICDEIFGFSNYVTSFVWRRRASSQMSQNNISVDHEYVVCYTKSSSVKFSGIKKDYANYSNPDNDPRGDWTLGDLTVGMTKEQRPNQYFDLIDPNTGRVFPASSKRVWTYAPQTMEIKLQENRIVFPKSDKGRPMLKRFLSDLRTDINPFSSWMSNESSNIGLNSEGTKIIQSIFDTKVFDYPKPVSLVSNLLSQIQGDNFVVLDSFAGSGTTANAVLELNKRDNGKRQFILIEMEAYAETVTAERVRRVINGYSNVSGTGGSFDFYQLGQALFKENGELNEVVGVDKIRRYIYYTETKSPLRTDAKSDNKYYLDTYNYTSYYFYYEADEVTTLNEAFLSTITIKAEAYLIYADNCLLSASFMASNNITFKKIPRDITKF